MQSTHRKRIVGYSPGKIVQFILVWLERRIEIGSFRQLQHAPPNGNVIFAVGYDLSPCGSLSHPRLQIYRSYGAQQRQIVELAYCLIDLIGILSHWQTILSQRQATYQRPRFLGLANLFARWKCRILSYNRIVACHLLPYC